MLIAAVFVLVSTNYSFPINLLFKSLTKRVTMVLMFQVKDIFRFLLSATYHLKLELSFVMDAFAMPPAGPDAILIDDGENNPITEGENNTQLTQKQTYKDTADKIFPETKSASDTKIVTEKEKAGDATRPVKSNSPASSTSCDTSPALARTAENRIKKQITKQESRISEILDFSDPLQNYQVSKDETIFHSDDTLQEEKNSNERFKKALKELHLTVSPFMVYTVPYLETEKGQKLKIRQYFRGPLYLSEYFSDKVDKIDKKSKSATEDSVSKKERQKLKLTEPHPFVVCKFSTPLSHSNTQVSSEFIAIDITAFL